MTLSPKDELYQQRMERLREMAKPTPHEISKACVRVVDLHKSFGSNNVLNGINLEIEEGKTTAILGASGSGKSVFVKHIIGLLKPDKGEIWVGDIDVTKLSMSELNELRKQFGMCFQMAALFDSMSVMENVAFPLVEHTKLSMTEIRSRVTEVLNQVGLYDVEDSFPSELSGGMRKRVGLARAVILKPQIVIYDEPTTGLDPLLTEEIDSMILDAQRDFQVTSIVISHDIGSVFRIADRVALLVRGVMQFVGTPEEMLHSSDPQVQKFITTFG